MSLFVETESEISHPLLHSRRPATAGAEPGQGKNSIWVSYMGVSGTQTLDHLRCHPGASAGNWMTVEVGFNAKFSDTRGAGKSQMVVSPAVPLHTPCRVLIELKSSAQTGVLHFENSLPAPVQKAGGQATPLSCPSPQLAIRCPGPPPCCQLLTSSRAWAVRILPGASPSSPKFSLLSGKADVGRPGLSKGALAP